jgi:hypothetical protein
MIERFYRKFFGRPKKNSSRKDEKLNPRDVYKRHLSQEISRIENLSVPANTLRDHLFDHRSPYHYGARCLAILSVGNQEQRGDTTIIKMPEPWQHLTGGENVGLLKGGIDAFKEAAREYEEAHKVEQLEN